MSRSLIARVWGAGGVRLLVGDCAVVLALAAAAMAPAASWTASRAPAQAVVEAGGRTAAVLDLAHDRTVEVAGPLGTTAIEARGGRVHVLSSPCPRQTCRHGGWIDAPGELLVCLPNRVAVRIAGRLAGGADAVSR